MALPPTEVFTLEGENTRAGGLIPFSAFASVSSGLLSSGSTISHENNRKLIGIINGLIQRNGEP
jgi:hypothetical protein